MSRRKLKSERELVADMNKRFKVFCDQFPSCNDCPLKDCVNTTDCKLHYIENLLLNYNLEDDVDE